MAIYVACNEFERKHPIETQPKWLKYCLFLKVNKNENGNWTVKYMLHPKAELKENQYLKWEDDGVPLLVQIEPITGKETIVICGGLSRECRVIFEVEVNFVVNKSCVCIDTDLTQLDGTKYEMNIRYS